MNSSRVTSRDRPQFCTACGTNLEVGAQYCGECGAKIPAEAGKRGRRTLVVIGAFAVVLSATAVFVWLGIRSPIAEKTYVNTVYGFAFEVPTEATVRLPPGQAGSVVEARDLIVYSAESPCTLSVHFLDNPGALDSSAYVDALLAEATDPTIPTLRVIERTDSAAAERSFHELTVVGFEGPMTAAFVTEEGVGLEVATHCPPDLHDKEVGNTRQVLLETVRFGDGDSGLSESGT